jgi:hypothetical protein
MFLQLRVLENRRKEVNHVNLEGNILESAMAIQGPKETKNLPHISSNIRLQIRQFL